MDDADLSTLPLRLAWARKRADLSAFELSITAGLTGSHTGLIERGTVARPQADTLSALAGVLGVTLDWLQSGVGDLATVAAAIDARRVDRAVAKAMRLPITTSSPCDGATETAIQSAAGEG